MNDKNAEVAGAEAAEAAAEHSLLQLLIALSAGAAALAAPPLALLILALLAARALLCATVRIELAAIAGPLAGAAIVGATVGLAAGIGVLFGWRLIVDARWSAAQIAKLTIVAGRPSEATWPALAHMWLTPIYGLALVAYTAPHMIAGLPLDLPHVPFWVPLIAGGLAAGAVFDWGMRRSVDWRLGELAAAPAAHALAHHTVFLAAFGLTLDVSAGIIAIAAWRLAHAAPLQMTWRRQFQPSFTAVP